MGFLLVSWLVLELAEEWEIHLESMLDNLMDVNLEG